MYCLFGTSLPKRTFPLPSFEHPALKHWGCALRTSSLSFCIDHPEDSGCSVPSHTLMRCQQSTSISQPLWVCKNEWMVYVVMNQAVWILEVKDIWCNFHVNNHTVAFPPQSHTFEYTSHILYPIDMYISIYMKMPFLARCPIQSYKGRTKSTETYLLEALDFNPEQSKWNIPEVSVVQVYAVASDAQTTMFSHVQIHAAFFFLPLW